MNPIQKLVYIHINPITSKMANMVQVVSMCDAFSRSGLHVTLILPISSSEQDNFEFLKSRFTINSEFELDFFVQNQRFGKGFGALFGIKKILSKYSGAQFFLRDSLISSFLIHKGENVVTELHNNILHANGLLNTLKKLIFQYYAAKSNMKAVITISASLKKAWATMGISESKLYDLHDGFDPLVFKENIDSKVAKIQLGLDAEKRHAIYVGNISFDRGIEKLVSLAKAFKNIEFVIVGGPDGNIQHYEELCVTQDVKNVRFLGYVRHTDVVNYLYASDILIGVWSRSISTMEFCSPLKVFEYMAPGRIIVCEAYTPIKEVLEDGITAYLAEPDELESLMISMNRAVNESSEHLARNSREHVFKNYSWHSRVEKIKQILDI